MVELRLIADATTVELFEARLQRFKDGNAVQENPNLLEYIQKEWLNCVPKWSKAHRQVFHLAVDTNNFIESLNNNVKTNGFITSETRGLMY